MNFFYDVAISGVGDKGLRGFMEISLSESSLTWKQFRGKVYIIFFAQIFWCTNQIFKFPLIKKKKKFI